MAAQGRAQWLNATDDKTTVVDGAASDMAAIGNVFSAADAIPDFGLSIDGATVTLMEAARSAWPVSASAAALSFPGAKLANNIQIPAPGGPWRRRTRNPRRRSGSVHLLRPVAPARGADGRASCRTIGFCHRRLADDGESRELLVQIADKIKGCPNGAVTVTGYTDNQGSDAVNLKLSDTRAKPLPPRWFQTGVLAAKMTARGTGSGNPIADNSTREGRAKKTAGSRSPSAER